ncbi:MAG: beta-lactamase family protein [Actinobacteria bacterium]|nr:beta-lactamase family protein [Actinomycetota bacterium]
MRRALLLPALVFALIAVLAAPASAAPLGKSTAAKLENALTKAWAKTKAPGVIAGVWIGGKGWTAVRGSTVKGKHVTPTLADHTRIGSVTKTFTGTVILQLVEEGKLKLDQTIQQWFPTAPEASNITIRELGDMSSGINTYTADPALDTRYFDHPQTIWKTDEAIEAGLAEPRKFPPGEGFFYSDTNTLMLGKIAEAVTGKSVGTLLRERIFQPLDLKATSFPATTKLPVPFWNGYTNQNVEGTKVRDSTHWSPSLAGAAGKMISTLPDLHRWTIALGTGSLLSPAIQKQRLKPNPYSVAGGREYLFCLGRDHGWLSHTGDIPGYNTTVAYLPKKKATIVVMANTDIEAEEALPTPKLFTALAEVVTPGNVPTGTH